jgi:PAS domain S-box-containing protein
MTDAASPIIIEGQHVANAFVGQFLLNTPDKEYFRQQAAQFGFNEQDYLNALNEVAIISEKKVVPIMDFLTSFAETVASMGLDKIRRKQYEKELLHHRKNLEEMVKERTVELRKLSQATENSPASVVVTDKNGTIEYVNPTFCNITGYSNEEAIGNNPRVLKSGNLPQSFYKKLWDTILSGKTWRGDFINRKKNGEEYWESASISPIKNNEGEITHFVAVKQDITERKEAEKKLQESEKRHRTLLERLPESVVVYDMEGKAIFVNPAFEKIFGWSLEEVLGKKIDFVPSELEAQTRSAVKKMLEDGDGSVSFETKRLTKNGDLLDMQINTAPFHDPGGRKVGNIVILNNITERKRMENELIEAKHAAVEANRAKGDFLANMSHEIRTPMNAVIGMSHLALKTDLSPKQRDYLNKIQSSANSLLGIINDILDFSKIEAGKLDIETVDFNLEDVMDNLANLVTVKAQEKADLEVLFNVSREVPRFLVGDPLRLGQVLINLANNAVKFTDSGEIVVSTELIKRNENRVTLKFSVRDTGIGLTKEQAGNLFQPFTQADTATTRKYGGSGLGLTISKRLAEMMGGEIWVESEYGQGATFSFTANFGLGKEKVKKKFRVSQNLRGMKVLVVDDNATSRDILQEMLESFSFEVSVAASGEEGITELENADKDKPFELVIMDWKMPGIDGIEASKRIKDHKGLMKIPSIVMVTAYGREEIMQQAEEFGLEGFLLKPVNSSILFDAIMQALGAAEPATFRVVQRHEQETEAVKHIKGALVLLVEDNEINQQVAKEILEGAGLSVSLANDGQEAVNAVKENNYDAVLMDVQMPVMDGYTATREIRKDERFKELPIIAMTAHAMAGDEDKSLESGMNGHVTKPIDPDQLFSALQKWIKPSEKRARVQKPEVPVESPESDKAVPEEDEFPESLPGFDLSDGLKRLQGNKTLYRKLLLNFATNYTEVANEIRETLDAEDFESAHSLVHNLKGLAGNLSAAALQAAAVNIEKLVKGVDKKAPSSKQLNLKFSELENALNQALDSVQILGISAEENICKLSDEEIAAVPAEIAQDIAKRIRDAAEMGDVTTLNAIAEEIKDQSDSCIPLSKQIIQMAEDFDTDGIQKLADALDAC